MEESGGGKIFSKIFKIGMRRWPDRSGLTITGVTDGFGIVLWYTEAGRGFRNFHILTELEYVEIGGKKYTVADGADRISAALEKEKVERLLERM